MYTSSNLLRPMRIGDILDGAIKLYRNNFRLLIGIAAWVYIPLCFLALISSQTAYVLMLSISSFLLPAVATVAISERILNREISVIGSYRRVGKRLVSLIGAMLLVLLVMFPAILVFSVLLAFLGLSILRTHLAAFLIRVAIVLVTVYFVIALMARLLFTVQAVVLEGDKATRALGRSMQLTKGSSWKILVVLILVSIAVFLIHFFFGLAGGALVAILGPLGTAWTFIARTGIINLFLQPFQTAVIVLLYYDMRVRKEGYDLEIMAKELAAEQV